MYIHNIRLNLHCILSCPENTVYFFSLILGTSCSFRSIQLCVFGAPHIESADVQAEDGGFKESPSKDESCPPPSFSQPIIKLLFCAGGLQLSYLTWAVLQERIVTRTYEEHLPDGSVKLVKFTNSQFLIFVNRSLALVVASVCILFTQQPRHTAPLYKYSYSSLSNILSGWCQYEALKYFSFPTQVLCKASKIIPVMIMGKIVSNKSYPYHEYVVAVLLSAGVSLFLLAADPSGKRTSAATTFSGAIILLGYMAFDSFTSNWQSELFSVYKMSTIQMMFGANLFHDHGQDSVQQILPLPRICYCCSTLLGHQSVSPGSRSIRETNICCHHSFRCYITSGIHGV